MTAQQSLVSEIMLRRGNTMAANAAVVLGGVVLLAALAQVSISLPFTPVPITGQTFGVALISLLWGRSRGVLAVLFYLIGGIAGLPIFALAQAGWHWGPTSGYLLGMLVASVVMGSLADRGWTCSWKRTWLAAFLGSCVTFLCGLMVLSLFVNSSMLLKMGLWPFLPGDFIKTLLVCECVRQGQKWARNL